MDLAGAVVVGLGTGVVTSWTAPRANWGIEKKRLLRGARVERIKEWRDGVAELRAIEDANVVEARAAGGISIVVDAGHPDPPEAASGIKPWFVTLRPELSQAALDKFLVLQKKRIIERKGQIPNLLADEITRIEREQWELI